MPQRSSGYRGRARLRFIGLDGVIDNDDVKAAACQGASDRHGDSPAAFGGYAFGLGILGKSHGRDSDRYQSLVTTLRNCRANDVASSCEYETHAKRLLGS
jgi:hypothetical protein